MADEKSFIESVGAVAKVLDVIKESVELFDEGVVEKLEELASIDIVLITEDLSKGNYLGNRKTDINLALNNLHETEEVTYESITLTLNNGIVIPINFEQVNDDGLTVVEEIASYTALYTKLIDGINSYNAGVVDVQDKILNYEIDVINQTIESLPTLLRIRDIDGSSCNIDRVVLSVYGGGNPIEQNPAYFWTKTTSSLEVLANRVGDIISLGNSIDKIIALSDKEDEIQYLYDAQDTLQTLSDNIQKIVDIDASLSSINAVNLNKANIDAVASNETNINAVNANRSKIDNVADNKSNIDSVADNKSNIDAVASNEININAVNTNKSNIDSVVAKMQDILNAPTHAQTATDKATESSEYAQDSKAYRDELTSLGVTAISLVSSEDATASYESATGVLTLGIPRGDKGDVGDAFDIDVTGTIAGRDSYDDELQGFAYLSTDEDPTLVYFKKSNASADWSVGTPFGKGDTGDTGADGVSITSIDRTAGDGSAGTTDTYTITMSDATTTTFNVVHGTDSALLSVAGRTGDVVLAKSDVGLGSVDNTSDANKPISTATQDALDNKEPADNTILKNANIGVSVQAYDEDTVVDGSYVHTDNNYSDAEKNKVAGVEAGATADQTKADIDGLGINATQLNGKTVVDSLTSTDTTAPASANQARILKGLIDTINSLLGSDETTLDELQEIVDYIQLNREDLDNLSIASIAGLQTALDNKLGSSTTAEDIGAIPESCTAGDFYTGRLPSLNAGGCSINSNSSKIYLIGAGSIRLKFTIHGSQCGGSPSGNNYAWLRHYDLSEDESTNLFNISSGTSTSIIDYVDLTYEDGDTLQIGVNENSTDISTQIYLNIGIESKTIYDSYEGV